MDFLMQEAAGISRRSISVNTEKLYQCLLKRYSQAMSQIPNAPPAFPVTSESVIAYLTFRKTMEQCSLNTIKADLSAIRRHLHVKGRWRSWCFVKYTELERREAGMRITQAI
jgi:hypothetical protein